METKPTVYILDDDPAVIRVLREVVDLLELRAEAYQSAREFLQTCKPSQPGCLILDVRMPDMGGLELQAELARRSVTLPVIFITGCADAEVAAAAKRAGAVALLEKPFRIDELCNHLLEAFGRDSASP